MHDNQMVSCSLDIISENCKFDYHCEVSLKPPFGLYPKIVPTTTE